MSVFKACAQNRDLNGSYSKPVGVTSTANMIPCHPCLPGFSTNGVQRRVHFSCRGIRRGRLSSPRETHEWKRMIADISIATVARFIFGSGDSRLRDQLSDQCRLNQLGPFDVHVRLENTAAQSLQPWQDRVHVFCNIEHQ